LDRIAKLAIPPAWTDVWICAWPHGHIQAVGTDKAGRRQYRYHDAWRVIRDGQKFERVLDFGFALPRLRDVVERDLSLDGLVQDRVLAATTRLLDLGFFRIGGEDYARENDTFGIASLQRRHVRIRDGQMIFDYPAKGSIRRMVTISDPETLVIVEALKRRRGGDGNLFAYRVGRKWSTVRCEDINSYIRAAAQGDYSAKDFRTWSATVLAVVELARLSQPVPASATARTRAVRQAVKVVAGHLGNTPAVCRSSYIDPRALDRFYQGESILAAIADLGPDPDVRSRSVRERIESAVVSLVAEDSRTASEAAA